MKALNIIESAYRATIEEQDDTIVWLTHAMKGAGADLAVLLRGNAVNYAALGQDAGGLAFGGWRQTQPPRIGEEIGSLVAKGVAVYAVAEDLAERGLGIDAIINGVERIGLDSLPQLLGRYDQVWHW